MGKRGRPALELVVKVRRQLEAILETQQRDLASAERAQMTEYASQCRGLIARTESAIRKLDADGVPEGWANKWAM